MVRMPRISAQATSVIVTLPNFRIIQPTPAIRITEAVKRLRLSSRSTFCSIFRPDTAMKPYSAMQTPPITQLGMVERKPTKGAMKAISIASIAVTMMVLTDQCIIVNHIGQAVNQVVENQV